MTAIPRADGSLADLAENKPSSKTVKRRAAQTTTNEYVLVVTTEYMFATTSKLTQKERETIIDAATNSDNPDEIMDGIIDGTGDKYNGAVGIDYKHGDVALKTPGSR